MHAKPGSYHHGDLKAALVAAATRLIEERGPTALSLRGVASTVGVSHGAPYRHFRSKQALLEAVAIEGFRELGEALDAVIEQTPDDPRQQMIDAGAVYVREAIDNAQRAQLMFGGLFHQGDSSPALRDAAEAAFSRCIGIIRRGQRQGVFRSGPSKGLVMAYWTASHGLAMLLISDGFGVRGLEESPEALWDLVADNLLAGLLAPPT
jgi:AcrR family transcriptional regulator